jgi:ATP-binding cassette subfamily B protein
MRVLKFIYQAAYPYRVYLYGIIFAIIVVAIDANVKPYLIKQLIDSVTENGSYTIASILIIYAIFQVIMMSAWSFNDWCITNMMPNLRTNGVTIMTNRLNQYAYTFFQDHLSGSLIAKINDVFNNMPPIIFIGIYQFIHVALIMVITLILLANIHIFFALGMLMWVTIFLTITFFGMKRVIPLTRDYAESKALISGQVSDTITNVLNVWCFSARDFERNRLKSAYQEYIGRNRAQGFFLMRFYILQGIIISIYTFAFIAGLIYLHAQGLLTPGDFALVFMLNFKIGEKLYDLSHQLREFVASWGTVDQAIAMLDLPIEIQDMPGAKDLVVRKGEIVFSQVHFRYKNAEPLFENKSVTIEPGQKVGLVGYSGGGKTTFVNLILRLYDVTGGHILIDGQDIKEVTMDSLRTNIGMIPQEPTLFHRSLMENIRYGYLDATDEEVIAASKQAHAHEFIEKLPKGYHSLVGERGVKLSGGQRQRIAIARAILKDAPILLLDEATSQLDSITEKYIQNALWQLMKEKTTIVIAHRLSTLLNMDRILVFDNGKIIEDGNHQELLAKGGHYKALWDAQVGGFLPDQRDGHES